MQAPQTQDEIELTARDETMRARAGWTLRQGEVLEAALGLLVSVGDKLTMTGVAREASCSKETLYKWFGDRDGLLKAIVRWQAAKVQVPVAGDKDFDAASLRSALAQFSENLLRVLSGDISVALNRIAISHAGSETSALGRIVLENGRLEMGRRLKPVLEAGRAAGLLNFDDSELAFRTLFGLVVRDVQIRLLLGETDRLTAAQIGDDAQHATTQFLVLYGTS